MKHKPTVQEMYQRKFRIGNKSIVMEIEDTSGMFAYDFPAMVGLSLRSVDAVLIVFSVTDRESFNQVRKIFSFSCCTIKFQVGQLRDIVMQYSCPDLPMVIVGNKTDEDESREVSKDEAEELIANDWENEYMECSAKFQENIKTIFQKLVQIANNDGEEIELVMDAPTGNRKFARRQSVQVSSLHQSNFLAHASPKKFFRRKSKSLQFEPADFEGVNKSLDNSNASSRRQSVIHSFGKMMRKTNLT